MAPTKIPKVTGVVRAIGVIILIPSFLGLGFAALVFLSTAIVSSNTTSTATTDSAQAGAAVASVIGFGFSLLSVRFLSWVVYSDGYFY